MSYHPTARERFTFLLILAICVGLVAASVFFVVRRPEGGYGQTLAITSGLLVVALYLNWMAWGESVPGHGDRRRFTNPLNDVDGVARERG